MQKIQKKEKKEPIIWAVRCLDCGLSYRSTAVRPQCPNCSSFKCTKKKYIEPETDQE